jgi:Predicted membrane protein, hemolysin III homolog
MDDKGLLHRSQIDKEFHDPFITKLYRRPNTDLKTALKSCFADTLSNEYFNVWSHVFAIIYFVAFRLPPVLTIYNLKDPLYWPLLALAVGILFLFSLSSTAHALNCMSKKIRNRCFYFDYAAISIFGMTTGQVFYFYCRKLEGTSDYEENLAYSPYIFLLTSISGSLVTNFMMCATRRRWCTSKALFRTLACLVPFAINSYPYMQRLRSCRIKDDCDTTWLPLFLKHVLYLLLTGVVNVCKFPERRYPGTFDSLGQSHHFVHILVFLACDQVFEFAHKEMNRRRVVLDSHKIKPGFHSCLLLTVFGVAANLTLAWMFNADVETGKEEKKAK